MNNRPVVLIIENSIAVTGALKSITRTAYDLKDTFDFRFVIPKNSTGRFWIEGKGFSVIYELPMMELSKRLSSLLLYLPFLTLNAFRLRKIVRREKAAIIHVNDLYNLLPVVLRLFGNKTPYVCHIRFLPNRFPSCLFNFWLKLHLYYASRLVAVSKSVLGMLPYHAKLIVIHNELPVEERFAERILPIAHKPPYTFLYLSNFMVGKGQNFALEAFAKVHVDLPDWRLRFVGGDMGLAKNRQYKLELRERAKSLGLLESIDWMGFTEEVEREYKQADIVLNFSESESFSITCLEALYFGSPVIATDCGGPSEIIDDRQTGILVANRNSDAMAMAMKELALDEELRVALSTRAKEAVRVKFSIENTSLKLKEVYMSVLLR